MKALTTLTGVAVLATSALLAACGGSTDERTPTDERTLSMWLWDIEESPEFVIDAPRSAAPGDYTLVISDGSETCALHFWGPGVDVMSQDGESRFSIRLQAGKEYTAVCNYSGKDDSDDNMAWRETLKVRTPWRKVASEAGESYVYLHALTRDAERVRLAYSGTSRLRVEIHAACRFEEPVLVKAPTLTFFGTKGQRTLPLPLTEAVCIYAITAAGRGHVELQLWTLK
jgi:hypothetical protein